MNLLIFFYNFESDFQKRVQIISSLRKETLEEVDFFFLHFLEILRKRNKKGRVTEAIRLDLSPAKPQNEIIDLDLLLYVLD